MRPGPAGAIKLIPKYLKIQSPPIRARDFLIEVCLGEDWETNRDSASERAEAWEKVFLQKARDELSDLNRLGRFSLFSINDSSSYLIQGAALIGPNDNEEIRKAKEKRARHSIYAEEIGKLTPTDFEGLCAGILKIIGVDRPSLTPMRADEGIDFFGKLSLEQRLIHNPAFTTFTKQMTIWLIGQAKHKLVTQVSTPDLRDLVGSIELLKAGTHVSRYPQIGEHKVRICDPIYYLFFTTGRISADAWKLIDKSGIIGMDGEMISAFLSDQEVGAEDGFFKPEAFRSWVVQFISQ